MKYLRIVTLIVALGFVANARATNVWTGFKHIVQIETTEYGGFLIRFDSQISSLCTNALSNGTELYIYPNRNGVTADGAKAMLATTLTAYSMGKQIEVLYEDSDPHCWGKYLVMN